MLPVLFALGVLFSALGIVFVVAAGGVLQLVLDYTGCAGLAPSEAFTPGPGGAFAYRNAGNGQCVLQFALDRPVRAPLFVYYRLSNFYQNNRLYARSFSAAQLAGAPLTAAELADCAPLVQPAGDTRVYYPCGLLANSLFTDAVHDLHQVLPEPRAVPISARGIAWPGDPARYRPTRYTPDQVLAPPLWARTRPDLVNPDGTYKALPALHTDERFMNWMRVSGLPTFRKLYGRVDADLPPGTYRVSVSGSFEVLQYHGTKALVLATTSWAGGQNHALGWGFLVVGALLLLCALLFLLMFLLNPRKVGDVSYLSWYADNQPPLPGAPPTALN